MGSATAEQIGVALHEVAQSAWALMVQRECVGFRSNNLMWLRAHYDIPAAALRGL